MRTLPSNCFQASSSFHRIFCQILELRNKKTLQKSPKQNTSKEMQNEIVYQHKTEKELKNTVLPTRKFCLRMGPCSNWVKQKPPFTTEKYVDQGLKYYCNQDHNFTPYQSLLWNRGRMSTSSKIITYFKKFLISGSSLYCGSILKYLIPKCSIIKSYLYQKV